MMRQQWVDEEMWRGSVTVARHRDIVALRAAERSQRIADTQTMLRDLQTAGADPALVAIVERLLASL